MLYIPPSDDRQGLLRHLCRNPHCRSRLKVPTYGRLDAFCCRGCFAGFFRSRCVVCEQILTRKNERQNTCRRPKCRTEFKRHRELFLGTRYPSTPVADISSRNPIKLGAKTGLKSDRAWRRIAGPAVPEINLRIPLDPELVVRLGRRHAEFFADTLINCAFLRSCAEFDRKARRSAARKALIKRRHPPVNIVGGYKFPNAPIIDLSPITAKAVMTETAAITAVAGEIPDFLKRAIPAAPRPAATDEAAAMPGDGLDHSVAEKEEVNA